MPTTVNSLALSAVLSSLSNPSTRPSHKSFTHHPHYGTASTYNCHQHCPQPANVLISGATTSRPVAKLAVGAEGPCGWVRVAIRTAHRASAALKRLPHMKDDLEDSVPHPMPCASGRVQALAALACSTLWQQAPLHHVPLLPGEPCAWTAASSACSKYTHTGTPKCPSPSARLVVLMLLRSR